MSQEEKLVEKIGSRDVGDGRRLGYLSMLELAGYRRQIKKELRQEKMLH